MRDLDRGDGQRHHEEEREKQNRESRLPALERHRKIQKERPDGERHQEREQPARRGRRGAVGAEEVDLGGPAEECPEQREARGREGAATELRVRLRRAREGARRGGGEPLPDLGGTEGSGHR